jgi:hypothetical protein
MAFKTINGKGVGPPRVATHPATGLAPKNGGMKAGTPKGAKEISGGPPPRVSTQKGGGTFKHPKSTFTP